MRQKQVHTITDIPGGYPSRGHLVHNLFMRSAHGTPKRTALPYFAIIAAVFLWGGSFAAMRSAIGEIGAFGLMGLRSLAALAAILPFIPRFLRQLKSTFRPGDGPLLFLTVLLQPCLYFLFESNALRFTTASQAGVISATVPILTALGAWIFLEEAFGGRIVIGTLMAFSGIAVITFTGNADTSAARPLLGNGLELGAMICAAGNLVAVRGLSRRYGTWLITAMQIAAGAVFFLPGIVIIARSGISPGEIPWIPVAYLGVGASLGAFGLYNWGMGRIPAARASSFINLIPVVAAFGAWLFLGEILNIYQIAGGVVVLSGVVLSQERRIRIIEADLQGREGSHEPV